MQFSLVRFLFAAAIVLSVVPELDSESVTLTTYYPAPSGVYTRMITTGDTYLARDGGRLGIGTAAPNTKLDVRGVIRFGPDNATLCAAALSGAVRWFVKAGDPNNNTLQVCDGTDWLGIDTYSLATNGGVCAVPGATTTSNYYACSCGYAGSPIWQGTKTSTCTPQPDGTNIWVTTSTDCTPAPVVCP